MPKCKKCGRWGFFLSLNEQGVCKSCVSDHLRSLNASISANASRTVPTDHALEQRNRESLEHRNREIAQLHTKYDFDTVEGIDAIPVPAPPINHNSTTGQIDYYLRMRASEYKQEKKMDLAIACLQKANALMPYSTISWQGKDYMRLVQYLKADGRFEEARIVEAELKKKFPELFDDGTRLSKKRFQEVLRRAKDVNTDLLEMDYHATCGECAKYQGRIYSISGQDKRYPALPDFFQKYGGVHPGCRHTFCPYLHGSPTASGKDAIAFSNRPFVDDRSAFEIAAYDDYIERRQAKEQAEADRIEYDAIREKLLDIAPKSFGGYRRMKSANSPAFQKLKDAAISVGIEIK